MEKNYLYYGDNLEVLRREIPDECVDLVYLDPPFNSNRSYNVLFENKSGADAQAQIQAFDDSWVWSQESESQYHDLISGSAPPRVADAVEAMRNLIGENDVLAYLVMMTPRLVELHRVLKPTGSLYLHCDPTASHYLKIVLDSVFGPTSFRNEVIWKRTGSHGSAKRYGPLHDVLLFYSKTERYTWNQVYGPYEDQYIEEKFKKTDEEGRHFQDITLTGPETRSGESGEEWGGYDPTSRGRHWAIPGFLAEEGIIPENAATHEKLDALDEAGRIYWTRTGTPRLKWYVDDGKGMPLADVWTDIPPINAQAAERLGYPTQKPEALMERIVRASSDEGDVVLDPFCGCGTTVAVAERLDRQWIGIDITYIAVDLITKRLRDTYGEDVEGTFEVRGIPRDLAGARALFQRSPFDFERWAVSLVDGQPNLKQVGDRGVDGVIRFPLDGNRTEKALVSVKGGKAPGPTAVRDLIGTVDSQGAALGLLVMLDEPTRGMKEAARKSGTYTWPWNGQQYPKVQIVTVEELLDDERPDMPPAFLPYIKAQRLAQVAGEQQALFDG